VIIELKCEKDTEEADPKDSKGKKKKKPKKKSKAEIEENLIKLAQEAINQIVENEYMNGLAPHVNNVFLWGFAHQGKYVKTLGEAWKRSDWGSKEAKGWECERKISNLMG